MSLSTPVALLVFNRPDLTRRVFDVVAKAKPRKLFIIADGPRTLEEEEKCSQVREIFEEIDWECEVFRNFSETNLGCCSRVSSGIDWVFSQVEEAIFLEDDCLPTASFFNFCETLLDYYRHDDRIMHISGNNFQFGQSRTPYSYYFSKYPHIWGWASWRRAWKHFDCSIKTWPEFKLLGLMDSIFGNPQEHEYWSRILDRMFIENSKRTWDYQWGYAVWSQGGISILPSVNLVSNIGFRPDATHNTSDDGLLANLPTKDIWTIHHPPFVTIDSMADAFTFDKVFRGKEAQSISNAIPVAVDNLEDRIREQEEIIHRKTERLTELRVRLDRVKGKLQLAEERLDYAENFITAMESSKFWKFRKRWIKLKNLLKLTTEKELVYQPPTVPQLSVQAKPQSNVQSVNRPKTKQKQLSKNEGVPLSPALIATPSIRLDAEQIQNGQAAIPGELAQLVDLDLDYIIQKVTPFTLVGKERMENLYRLSKRIEEENLPGDILECGVCNGGTAAILAHFATNSRKFDRTVWLFDSFEGMPVTTEEDGDAAKNHIGKEVGDVNRVQTVLNLVNSDMTRVRILKGWFENTFPTVTIPKIALLNIDADWYASVKLCLETFYDAVVPGGFISFDDYGHWVGCKQAVDEFFQERNLQYKLHEVDYTARWIQKL